MQRPGPTDSLSPPSNLLALPGSVPKKSIGRSLEYWIVWLEPGTQGPYTKLRRALLSKDIPAHVVHHFACDCMERTMNLSLQTGPPLPNKLWDAFEAKRGWVEGLVSWNHLEQNIIQPTLDLLEENKEFYPSHLLQMLKGALRKEHTSAALSSVYHPIFPQDRSWQCRRLQKHLIELQEQHKRLAALLSYRSQILAPQLQRWQQDLEDALFEKD